MIYFKYPRTPHLPFSASKTDDDKSLSSDGHFKEMISVVVTEKMDGENTTVYPNGKCHARSIDSIHKSYHSWLMNDIQNWCYKIPEHHRVCGEYMYAKHSIQYDALDSYFYGFSVWDGSKCLSWDDTVDLFKKLSIQTVPVIYIGVYDTEKVKQLFETVVNKGGEGIVVRTKDSFYIDEFSNNVAKCVRANHVQTDVHWSQSKLEINGLRSD